MAVVKELIERIKGAPIIGVIGASECDEGVYKQAYEVGRLIAERGATLICGGLGGVMEAASRGAYEAGGLTIGVIPGFSATDANPYVAVPIVTGLSHARNVIIVRTCQVAIAISGSFGTLSEIAFAMTLGKPVVSLGSWKIDERIIEAASPKDAVDKAFGILKR